MVMNTTKRRNPRISSSLHEASQQTQGLALVEAALVLLLLIIVVLGAIEYGWLFGSIHVVQNAAQIGAREAVLPDASSSSVQSAVDTVMTGSGYGASGYTISVSPADIVGVPVGGLVTVTVTVPYSNIELLGLSIFPTPAQLRGSVTMAKEGP